MARVTLSAILADVMSQLKDDDAAMTNKTTDVLIPALIRVLGRSLIVNSL